MSQDTDPIQTIIDAVEGNGAEVDHSVDIYLSGGRRMPPRETAAIREAGYKIQDITVPEGREQVRVRCVRRRDGGN